MRGWELASGLGRRGLSIPPTKAQRSRGRPGTPADQPPPPASQASAGLGHASEGPPPKDLWLPAVYPLPPAPTGALKEEGAWRQRASRPRAFVSLCAEAGSR